MPNDVRAVKRWKRHQVEDRQNQVQPDGQIQNHGNGNRWTGCAQTRPGNASRELTHHLRARGIQSRQYDQQRS